MPYRTADIKLFYQIDDHTDAWMIPSRRCSCTASPRNRGLAGVGMPHFSTALPRDPLRPARHSAGPDRWPKTWSAHDRDCRRRSRCARSARQTGVQARRRHRRQERRDPRDDARGQAPRARQDHHRCLLARRRRPDAAGWIEEMEQERHAGLGLPHSARALRQQDSGSRDRLVVGPHGRHRRLDRARLPALGRRDRHPAGHQAHRSAPRSSSAPIPRAAAGRNSKAGRRRSRTPSSPSFPSTATTPPARRRTRRRG